MYLLWTFGPLVEQAPLLKDEYVDSFGIATKKPVILAHRLDSRAVRPLGSSMTVAKCFASAGTNQKKNQARLARTPLVKWARIASEPRADPWADGCVPSCFSNLEC